MENRVVVTGLGIISPLGNDVSSTWKALCSGVSGVGPLTSFDASAYEARIAAEVKDFDASKYGISPKDARRMEKFIQYALASTSQALADAGLDPAQEDRDRIGLS